MTNIYEGMFLLDNEVVRQDWKRAKEVVTGTLEKHGAKIHAARRWDERRLAYPIERRRRATYLLAYYEIAPENIVNLCRDIELSEPIMRYLLTSTAAVPEGEYKLSEVENSADFSVPAPPDDDAEADVPMFSDQDDPLDDDSGRRGRPRGRKPEVEEVDASDDDSTDDEDTAEAD